MSFQLAKDIHSLGLTYNKDRPHALKKARELSSYLTQSKGIKVYTFPEQKLIPNTKPISNKAIMKKLQLFIVLGGDGTYLKAVHRIDDHKCPILGINMGSLGLLTGNRSTDMFSVVNDTLNGKMETRPSLHDSHYRKKW